MHNSVAAKVRRHKEEHPEAFCPNRKCLWRASSGPCPKHQAAALATKKFDDYAAMHGVDLNDRSELPGADDSRHEEESGR